MQTILVVFHLFLALGLIGLVLMQHGKGADAGAAFGAGASGSVFGAQGAANFLSRATAILAALFFITSLVLGWYAMQGTERPGLMVEESAPVEVSVQSEIPAPGASERTVTGESEVPAVMVPEVAAPAEGEVPKVAE